MIERSGLSLRGKLRGRDRGNPVFYMIGEVLNSVSEKTYELRPMVAFRESGVFSSHWGPVRLVSP
jgi:hypothetical protein